MADTTVRRLKARLLEIAMSGKATEESLRAAEMLATLLVAYKTGKKPDKLDDKKRWGALLGKVDKAGR